MSYKRALRWIALGLGLAYAFPAACGSGGLVGGKCKSGYTNCDGKCVDLQSDYRSCGSCKNECPGELACLDGLCGGEDGGVVRPEGGASNIGTAGNGNTTAGMGQAGEGELPDGGFFDSPVDGQGDADVPPIECLPPHDVPSHCGDCDTQCAPPRPLCAPDGNGSFECVPKCEPPLVECDGRCMLDPDDFQRDPENCGRCGNKCPSDICEAGICRGAKYGNVALLCSDFNSATSDSAPTVLLGNAVFMPATNPVNVLAYTRGASAAAVTRVNQVIAWAGTARGRTAKITEAKTPDQVTKTLSNDDYQVLLIHDLDRAASGEPGMVAAEWENDAVLSTFTKAGGVIVVLDGADGTGEMHELITAGNLFDVDGQRDVTGNQMSNQAPFDVLGVNVISPYLGTSHTCVFDTTVSEDDRNIFVVTDESEGDAPAAIHRVIAP